MTPEQITLARIIDLRKKLMSRWEDALAAAKSSGNWEDVRACGAVIDSYHNEIADLLRQGKFSGDPAAALKSWNDIQPTELEYRRTMEAQARADASNASNRMPQASAELFPTLESVFHTGPELVGSLLLSQFVEETGPLVFDADVGLVNAKFPPEMQIPIKAWQQLFATWLLKLLADAKFGEEFGRRVMASVYGRLAANEDRSPQAAELAGFIKYWYRELDKSSQNATKSPVMIQDEVLPVTWHFAMTFLVRDTNHPYAGQGPDFGGADLDVMEALAHVQDVVKPRIDAILEHADRLPR
ncbi:MAG: hypothetical protein WA418_33650 [Bradyrhizobium sp.]